MRDLCPSSALSVLDVGCGHGRFAAYLDGHAEQNGSSFSYLGIDVSEPLLSEARARSYDGCQAEFRLSDPLAAGPESLPPGPFSLAVLFGFLHHVPSAGLRERLLTALADRLTPGGLLAFTCWDFASHERFRRRLVDWHEWNRSASPPIDLAQLEPGDHLLPWGDTGNAVRYCHFSDEAEIEALLCALPSERFERIPSWVADGREGRLNRYYVLRARG